MSRWDAVVVGAGAGGGVAAYVLAKAGKKVLLLERGRWLDFASTGRDHLRNHRLELYGNNTGPELEGNPRVFVDSQSNRRVVNPIGGGYNNNASCVGSGTLVYGGQAWRFHPLDFRMASTYGVPAGSSLADWPISYDDLAPYYELAEWEVGVAGSPPAPQMPSRRDYPMPAHPLTTEGGRLREGAAQLGWETQAVPLLVSSVPRDGRPACAACQHCVGFACPVDAKNGTQNTVIKRAIETGRCEVWAETFVTGLVTTAGGQVTGVRLADNREISAETVVLACGAIETARLLLNSKTAREPNGIGNNSDQVGRHLQGHYYAHAFGHSEEPIWDGVGPGPTTATLEFNHGNDGVIGGAMLADDFIMMPIVFARNWRPADVPKWGQAHKDWMREGYRRFMYIAGPVQEISSPDSRVQVDPVRDRFGVPVAHLSGTTHPETVRTTEFAQARAREWLVASGALNVGSRTPGLHLSAGQHQAGTCRMGHDPALSVCDPNGRVHGHENLFVCDSSVHVTNGGFNPVLTIMALAWRTAEKMVS